MRIVYRKRRRTATDRRSGGSAPARRCSLSGTVTLASGTRLGSYEILAPLGAGGMGEVYRARDTKLSREVAIKILPEAFAQDAERLARFQREAQVLASLNHPNIAHIHGLEESGYVQPSHGNIYRLTAEGGPLEPVTRFPEGGLFLEEPTLSPDGRYLYYCRSNGGSSMWLMTLEDPSRRP